MKIKLKLYRHKYQIVLFVIALLFAVYMSFISKYYIVNFVVTKSIDRVAYIAKTSYPEPNFKNSDFKTGDLIAFYIDKDSIYWSKKVLISKYIKCKEGDLLEVKGKEYFCNGAFLGKARDVDSFYRPLQAFNFNGNIPANNYFVMGTDEKSWDSRYFGFVKLEKIALKGVI